MQYIASLFGLSTPDITMPNVLFFDAKDGLTKSQMRNMAEAKANAHRARTVLGIGSKLNPIAGQYGNKYFPTFAKYAADVNWSPASYDPVEQINTIGFSIHASDPKASDYQSYEATKSLYFPDYTITRGTILINCPFDVNLHFPKCAASQTIQTDTQFGRLPSTLHLRQYNSAVVTTEPSVSDQFIVGYGYPSIAAADMYTAAPVNFRYAMAMKNISVTSDRGNKADMYLPYRSDGIFWAPRTADDETVNLTFGLFYWKAFNTLVMLDENDYEVASNLIPGTRPKLRFKEAKLSI